MMNIPRTALITGASGGIGRAIAVALAEDGYGLIGVHYGKNLHEAQATADAIRSTGATAVLLPGDLKKDTVQTVRRIAETFLASVETTYGSRQITTLVNNAGINGAQDIETLDEETYRTVMDVNLTAPLFLVQALYPHFARAGRIINVSTGYTRIAAPSHLAYSASKSALNGATLALAPVLGQRGMTINAVTPGIIDTGINRDWIEQPGARDHAASLSVFNRIGEVADIASLVRFLASEAATWTTGQIIDASGGTGL